MSLWYCETHGLTGPATRITGICDVCGAGLQLATVAISAEMINRAEVEIHVALAREEALKVIDDKVAAETDRCAGIVRDNMWADSGSTPESRQMNILLEHIISEIRGAN